MAAGFQIQKVRYLKALQPSHRWKSGGAEAARAKDNCGGPAEEEKIFYILILKVVNCVRFNKVCLQ